MDQCTNEIPESLPWIYGDLPALKPFKLLARPIAALMPLDVYMDIEISRELEELKEPEDRILHDFPSIGGSIGNCDHRESCLAER